MSELNIPSPALVAVIDDVATTTSLIIADGTENEHRAVLQLIRNNLADFEEFGGVAFQMRTLRTAGGPQEQAFAVLTEEHATLLITYMKNSATVRDFKKRLVREFWQMRRAGNPAVNGADLTRLELIQIAMNAETERLALESENKELAPKAEAFDSFLDATGKYSIGAVAKMLGTSQNKLFRDLRNIGVLISKGAMRNTPYQQYMRYFEVKAHDFERNSGEMGCSYTTYVQPSGIDFVRRKLNLPSIDPQFPAVSA